MRKVISNNEQTAAIRNRRPFGTRKMGYGYVYQGIPMPDGSYELWHWNTLIARLDCTTEGGAVSTYLEDDHRSVTTNAYRSRIWQALTPDERQSAAYGIVKRERDYARTRPYLHADKGWRDRLAYWETYAYPEG